MKKLKRFLNRRLRAGPLIWAAAFGAAGLFFALPDLKISADLDKAIAALQSRAAQELQKHLPEALQPASSGLQGIATVIDGDTIDIQKQRIRLHAIDAPESAQRCWKGASEWRCGQTATLALKNKIDRHPVRCEQINRDRYGRIVARCFLGETNLNAWLVEEGHAVAAPQYGKDYIAHEARAQAARRGIWAGEFIVPSDWRKGVRQPQG
ncbi:thermonuclease family protein [Falsigemmobacter faecalis]|uniref:Thermonuclease family protein n=1 Tax=Falsigemmobacter faecalis TaxID=2488730 RepID=A0A3P3DDS1_9RHOB|nr:thermonuclease family protein [Falsigemmobacter faecalis]RRH72465.1 thermonuclease family protein [Falsigemmobacter faecalis]